MKGFPTGGVRSDSLPFNVRSWSQTLSLEEKKETLIPVYRLPSREDFERALAYNDSIMPLVRISKKYEQCRELSHSLITQDSTFSETLLVRPTYGYDQSIPSKYGILHYLKSNVDEYVHPAGSAGYHSFHMAIAEYGLDSESHPWIGFRNCCTWQTVETYLSSKD